MDFLCCSPHKPPTSLKYTDVTFWNLEVKDQIDEHDEAQMHRE